MIDYYIVAWSVVLGISFVATFWILRGSDTPVRAIRYHFSVPTEERPLPYAKQTTQLIRGAAEWIRMVAGDVDPGAYSKEVCQCLRAASDRGVDIGFLAGPLLLNGSRTEGGSGILQLAKDGKISLYISRRWAEPHFHATDKGVVHLEETHDPGPGDRTVLRFDCNLFEASGFRREFRGLTRWWRATKYTDYDRVRRYKEKERQAIVFSNRAFYGLMRWWIDKNCGGYLVMDRDAEKRLIHAIAEERRDFKRMTATELCDWAGRLNLSVVEDTFK